MSFFNKLKAYQKKSEEQADMGLHTLLKGEWGLAKTFWLYYFMITLVVNIIFTFTEKQYQLVFLIAVSIYIGATALIAIKNTFTADNKLWWRIALAVIAIGLLSDVISLIINLFPEHVDAYLESL